MTIHVPEKRFFLDRLLAKGGAVRVEYDLKNPGVVGHPNGDAAKVELSWKRDYPMIIGNWGIELTAHSCKDDLPYTILIPWARVVKITGPDGETKEWPCDSISG